MAEVERLREINAKADQALKDHEEATKQAKSEQDKRLEALEKQIEDLRAHSNAVEIERSEQADQAKELHAKTLADLQEGHASQIKQLEDRTSALIQEKEASLKTHAMEIEDLKQSSHEREQKLDEAEARFAELQEKMNNLQKQLAAKDTELTDAREVSILPTSSGKQMLKLLLVLKQAAQMSKEIFVQTQEAMELDLNKLKTEHAERLTKLEVDLAKAREA
jgi:molybdopterin converting factor small subunit